VPSEPADPPDLSGDDALEVAQSYLIDGRRAIDAAFDLGLPATEATRRRAALHDRVLKGLFAAADRKIRQDSPASRFALCAVGGYGTGRLSPASDLDLLFLHAGQRDAYVEKMSAWIQYRLWDLSLTVGASVRTISECVHLARTDLTAYTALLDLRWLAGDAALCAELEHDLFHSVFGHGVEVFLQMREHEDERRRKRYADTVYLLQPDLKHSEGGLRDWQQALWAARVGFHARGLEDLLGLGVVTEREVQAALAAHEFLLAVREQLHRFSGRKNDRLTFEAQERIAEVLGLRDSQERLAVERFMQRYYQAARTVRQLARRILDRSAAPTWPRAPGGLVLTKAPFTVLDGALTVTQPDLFQRHPLALLEVFQEATIRDLPLCGSTQDLIAAHLHLVDDRFRADPAAAALFLQILCQARDRRGVLRQMHDLGLLGAYLPEFERLTGLSLHLLFHVYTVDVHTLHAVEKLKALHRGDLREEAPHVSEVMAEIERPRTLYLATLLHDLGKGTGCDHSTAGADLAGGVCRRLGLDPRETEAVEALVRNHLLLVHTATRRDLTDEDLLRSFCEEVGGVEELRQLYVLTYVDSVTTGPGVWSDWKALLTRELYERALARLQGPIAPDQGILEAALARLAESRAALLRQAPAEEVEAYLASLPQRYFLCASAEAIARHFDLSRRRGNARFAFDARPHPARGYTELSVTCDDRPGLLSLLTGALRANGIDILSAAIFTRSTGEALDVFHVRDRRKEAIQNGGTWERLCEHLQALLDGKTTVEALLSRVERSTLLDRSAPRVRTRVEIDNQASSTYTVVDVITEDRLGVLYLITHTLFLCGLSIGLSKVTTEGNRVVDAFYVTDVGGGKVTDPLRLQEIRKALQEALGS
jgi:[protein-PII] uridylyltransferase